MISAVCVCVFSFCLQPGACDWGKHMQMLVLKKSVHFQRVAYVLVRLLGQASAPVCCIALQHCVCS